ncbi:MAG: polyprenyl synthetase family protein [Candidatus Hydrogenedentota bacterium]
MNNDKLKENFEEFLYKKFRELATKTFFDESFYSLKAGGKRLRPLLVLNTSLKDKLTDDVLYFASAVELIHTYSLIHDDLPCMDDDELRRGKPTSHKVFGEEKAIFAGINLLNTAFKMISRIEIKDIKNRLKEELVSAAGIHGMVGGQLLDLFGVEEELNTFDEIEAIHLNKTAKMIMVAVAGAAILKGLTSNEIRDAKESGIKLGLCFQIVDDILDETGQEKEIGKPIKSDIKNNKKTAVSVLGLNKAKEKAKKYIKEAKESLPTNLKTTDLNELIDFVLERTH